MFRLISFLVIFGLSSSVFAQPDDRKAPDTDYVTTSKGDVGYFQTNGSNEVVMLVYNSNQDNIVSQFRSAAGHKYKIWIDDGRAGAFPVNLKDDATFRDWLNLIDAPSNPNKHYCELVESPWSPWTPTGPVPACGNYTESRTCSTQGAIKPCPGTCPANPTEFRTVSQPACCTITSWLPPTGDWCPDERRTQTSNCGDTRQRNGTRSCACRDTSWTPRASTYCPSETRTQTSNCGNTRRRAGTRVCADPNPVCGTLHNRRYSVSTSRSILRLRPFNATLSELCAVGINTPAPRFDGTGADGLILWGCRSNSRNRTCAAIIVCDNLGTSPCTTDRN